MSEDVYKRGAMKVLGQPEHVVTHEQRQAFKQAFFDCYRERIYRLGENVPLAVAEDNMHKAKGLMERRLQRVWPQGTIVLVQITSRHKTPTTAKVIGYDGMEVKIEVCKANKAGKNYRLYVHWEKLVKWPQRTDDL